MNKLVFVAVALMLFSCNKTEERLPVLGEKHMVEKEVDGKKVIDTVYKTIPSFSLVNQYGNVITNKSLDDDIYVADFFFTSCPTICPKMKQEMLRVHKAYIDDEDIKLVSHTLDPRHDTVEVLRDYAEGLGVKGNQWHFLTGEKSKIYDLAEQGYMVSAMVDPSQPGGIIHSGALILVDKKGRIRGVYDGTKGEEVDELIADIRILKQEYE